MAIRKAAGYKRDGEREKRGERERECQSKLSIRAKDELRKRGKLVVVVAVVENVTL